MSSTAEQQGPFFLGIDLGGTNVKAGVVSELGESLSHVTRKTEADRGPEHGVRNICTVGDEAIHASGLDRDEIVSVGLATPGTMDIPAGMLLNPHNLPGWNNLPIRQLVADHFQKPTVLQNDANAAAYGEYWIGAGRSAHSLLFWTLGTGVGGGIIFEDVIIEGEHSCGSECGHIIIEMDHGRPWKTGQTGTLEAYASASALIEQCRLALAAGRSSMIQEWLAAGEDLNPLLMAKAAGAGDALCNELILHAARCLGVGTVTMMHALNPAIVLIGGAMTFGRNETDLGRRFLQTIKDEVARRAFPIPAERTIIDYARLGGNAGYIGAAGCARRAHYRSQS